MRKLLSTLAFVVVFAGLGLTAYLAIPHDAEVVAGSAQVASVASAVVAQSEAAAPAASPKLNDISLPLDVQSNFAANGLTFDVQGLADNISSGTATVSQVLRWNPNTQTSDSWDPNLGFGFVGGVYTETPFALQTGKAYRLLVTDGASIVYSIVGDVPAAGTFPGENWVGSASGCKLNHFMIPLDKSGVTNADLLADDIGTSGVTQVLRWNASSQTSDSWDPNLNFGFVNGVYTETPFSVEIGHPYWICANDTINGQSWPTP